MEISTDKRAFGVLQATVITAGFVFAMLFVRSVWVNRELNLGMLLGDILFFGAAGLEFLPNWPYEKADTRYLASVLVLIVSGALIILAS